MKKLMILVAAVVCGVLFCGCQVGPVDGYGFGSTGPALIITDQIRGSFMLPKTTDFKNVTILGKVTGKASARNILLLVAEGNCGIEAAKKDALSQYPKADDILNIEVDTHYKSILMLFQETTTVLRGVAVKYNK